MLKRLAEKFLNAVTASPWVRYSLVRGIFMNMFDERARMMEQAMKFAAFSKLEGDYLEFGSYIGKSMINAYHCARSLVPRMRFYAFDSFEGIPSSPSLADTTKFQQFHEGDFSCTEDHFKKMLAKNKVDLSAVRTVVGWYKDTLNERTRALLSIQKAAVVNIDCDVYESASAALDFVVPYLQDGTVILFDDWFTYRANTDQGEQRAFKEWLERNPTLSATQYRVYGWSGNSFVVHIV